MYQENGNTKVTLVVHSYGGQVSLYFLNRIVNQQWKDTYIHSYIPLAAAWSGGAGIDFVLLSGSPPFSFLETQIGISRVISIYQYTPSFYYLLPRASIWNDTVIVRTSDRNYTASTSDYQQLFTDAGIPDGYSQFLDSEKAIDLSPPSVTTYCFYGLGIPTPLTFEYGDGFNETPTDYTSDDGDGLVNRQGLEVCRQWEGRNGGYMFNLTIFQGVDHSDILRKETVLQTIASIAQLQVPTSSAFPLSTLQITYLIILFIVIIF